MSLKITPNIVRHAYAMLRETPPFNRWKLPDPDDMKFSVTRTGAEYGCVYAKRGEVERLTVSDKSVGSWGTLLATVAHEAIHVRQVILGMEMTHGDAFKKMAAAVCRHHRDFDPKNFC